jgi:putative inorganic carbon (hco3(-)) transporter
VSVAAQVGAIVGAVGLAVLLLTRDRRARLAGLASWAVGLGVLGLTLLPDLRPELLAAAGLAGLLLSVGGAWALDRWPYLLAFLTIASVPARIPLDLGDDEVSLLLPLYAVIGSLALQLGWRLLRDDRRSRELGPVAWPLSLFVVWSAVSMLWTNDVDRGALFMGAFLLPFGLLSLGIARLPWRGRMLTWLWGLLVATAAVFAAIGVVQWWTRNVFWNPRVIVENAYAPFFRVNSVFWDPSVYGRYLVLAILASLTGILLGGVKGWRIVGLYAVVVTTWLGLLLSLSQSSFVALAVGIVVAAGVAWGQRVTLALLAMAFLALGIGFAVPQVRDELVGKSRSELRKITRGRSDLVGQGVRIALDRPVAGVGIGGFPRAYGDRIGKFAGSDAKRVASHTTPVTVAAEQGAVGLVLYLSLLVVAFGATLRGLGHGFTSRVSLAVGVCLVAIAVHSLFYAAFFEDPMTWALLGLVGLVVTVPRKPLPKGAPE